MEKTNCYVTANVLLNGKISFGYVASSMLDILWCSLSLFSSHVVHKKPAKTKHNTNEIAT